jgi:hypothetical protein
MSNIPSRTSGSGKIGVACNGMKKALNLQGFFHPINAAETDRPD